MSRVGLSILCATLVGCVDDGAPVVGTSGIGCEVGIGEDTFESLDDGEEVSIIAGPQGGYHITTAAWAHGVEGDTITVSGTLRLAASGDYLGPGFTTRWPVEEAEDEVEIPGLLNLLSDPERARNQEILLAVTVEDASGGTASDERVVVAR